MKIIANVMLVPALIGLMIYAHCSIKSSEERRNTEYNCLVEYTNGDTSTIKVVSPQPYLNGRGCIYCGYSYVCGVRRIIRFQKTSK